MNSFLAAIQFFGMSFFDGFGISLLELHFYTVQKNRTLSKNVFCLFLFCYSKTHATIDYDFFFIISGTIHLKKEGKNNV